MANRVLVREEAVGEGLIDEHLRRCIGARVVLADVAQQKGHAKRVEIVRADGSRQRELAILVRASND